MYCFQQELREATLKHCSGKSPQETADQLNLIEAIIEDKMSVEEVVNGVSQNTLPVRYEVRKS